MTRLSRRLLLVLALLIATLAILSAVGVTLFRGTPEWYGPSIHAASAAQRESYAAAAENKLIETHNWAELLRADQTRAALSRQQGATTVPFPRAGATHVIEFTQDELDALLDKWSALYGWRQRYDPYLEDPRVVLRDGNLILAGRVKDLGGAVASFHFRPRIDPQGKLHLDLVRVAGGKLPLPDAVWGKWRDTIVQSLRRQIPQWQTEAQIDDTGSANFPAMAVIMSRLLFAATGHYAAEPVLFLPLVERGRAVPVRIAKVSVTDEKLTLVVEPLSVGQRKGFLDRIRAVEVDAPSDESR